MTAGWRGGAPTEVDFSLGEPISACLGGDAPALAGPLGSPARDLVVSAPMTLSTADLRVQLSRTARVTFTSETGELQSVVALFSSPHIPAAQFEQSIGISGLELAAGDLAFVRGGVSLPVALGAEGSGNFQVIRSRSGSELDIATLE
jgi:hypothetical protein